MADSVTSLIGRWRDGDAAALEQLMPIVYSELHRIASGYMRSESPSHTLQPTALINELYLRLAASGSRDFHDRTHFMAIAARVMRSILVDHARARGAAKRGGGKVFVAINDELDFTPERAGTVVALHEGLEALTRSDEEKARLVELRFFGGMTAEEIALVQSKPVRRVRSDLRLALAWLHREVAG
ncbi:DNA-directed RNA polymerase sigma-70 factor [Bryobacterales bacterium F-183]|nr:DNA-directed RNA polymerase sigma-70 factor [Bryobacterales bacterium F-183]